MSANQLTDEQRFFIIEALAAYDTPSTVVAAVKREFKIDVTRQAVEAYDPYKRAGANMASKWKVHFDKARERFMGDIDAIPASHRSVRVHRLQRMAEKAEADRNLALAAQLYEQIAKELGDTYTNKRDLRHTSPDGSMSPRQVTHDMTPREASEAYEASLNSEG